METFKITLRIVFGLASVLNAYVAVCNFFRGSPTVFGMVLFYVNLIDYPLFLAFIFVFLINWLFMKRPVLFFKTEFIYLFIDTDLRYRFARSFVHPLSHMSRLNETQKGHMMTHANWSDFDSKDTSDWNELNRTF